MERITRIVRYREECPNCGAPRTGDMRFCGYCGSTLAIDEQVVEDVSYLADVNRPVDIISTLEPLPVLGKKSNRNLLIAVIVFVAGMAIALWVFPFIFRQNEAEICATVIILFAFLFFVLYRYSEEYYCLKGNAYRHHKLNMQRTDSPLQTPERDSPTCFFVLCFIQIFRRVLLPKAVLQPVHRGCRAPL